MESNPLDLDTVFGVQTFRFGRDHFLESKPLDLDTVFGVQTFRFGHPFWSPNL
ncbi:hypothetical protein QUF54_02795 [Candidatus Marithioploca araucensis]|uniref:Uncharacterized protein n=1 Tax=Candidatus Marithioploca araucensis TaxID=70273 RepID=A0ABT7VRI1_9GAMM|nr:hypothetical protein [Candidatus Marithioploca araucensis]